MKDENFIIEPKLTDKKTLENCKLQLGLYESLSGRGGARKGSGRKKQGNEIFYKRCNIEQKKLLDEFWEKIKQ